MDAFDEYDFDRFLKAQEHSYHHALHELQAGRKRTHWIWYIFPQPYGVGTSELSQKYALEYLEEAEAYLQHPTLGERLLACTAAVLQHADKSPRELFGSPDDWKVHSCMTLFAAVSPPDSLFHQVLDALYDGKGDPKTLRILKEM